MRAGQTGKDGRARVPGPHGLPFRALRGENDTAQGEHELGRVGARPRWLAWGAALLLAAAAGAEQAPSSGRADIQGQLRLARGVPVVGATILVHAASSRAELYVTATDEKGFFHLDGLESDTYRFEARREGLEPLVKDALAVRYPYRAIVEATMEKAASDAAAATAPGPPPAPGAAFDVAGTVRDPQGSPLADARIRLMRPDGSADPVSVPTRADGGFEISGVAAGAWDLEIEGGGFLPLRLRLDLERSTRLHARLVPHPLGYTPAPEDLMPPEEPIPPAGLFEDARSAARAEAGATGTPRPPAAPPSRRAPQGSPSASAP